MFERRVKLAQMTLNMGDPSLAGRGIADIVKFLMQRVPPEDYKRLLGRLRQKVHSLNEREIASINLNSGSAIGQSITFIKNVLMGHNSTYIRQVINNIVRNL